MVTIKRLLKNYFFHIFLLTIIGFIILYPTFDLALTGDDYLGFWRLEQKVSEGGSYFDHFFTDYGPQDLLTVLIHSIVGFNSTYYYLAAFLLRLIAAISLYPVTLLLTKNKKAGLLASLFFLVSTTGMEVVDWSFNMPSYIGIALMNISLVYLIKSLSGKYLKYILISASLFVMAILSQPLRLLILIVIFLGIILYYFAYQKQNKVTLLTSASLFTFLFILILFATNYKFVGGVTSRPEDSGFVRNILFNVSDKVDEQGIVTLISPIAQIGNIVFPTQSIPQEFQVLSNAQKFLALVVSYIIFATAINLLNTQDNNSSSNLSTILILFGTLWGVIVALLIIPLTGVQIITSNFLGYLIGGYFLLLVIYIFLSAHTNKDLFKIGIVISMLVVAAPILPFWIRNPGEIQITYSRYLIVSSAGVALMIGLFYNRFKKNNIIIFSIILLLLFNMFELTKYVKNLHAARNKQLANKIRSEMIYKTEWAEETPTMIYYLEAGNAQVFYHSLYFGFPFFINYYKGELENPWNIAYSTEWQDIESAHTTGETLNRFGVDDKTPINIENVYSYKLQGSELINTTEETRKKLTRSFP